MLNKWNKTPGRFKTPTFKQPSYKRGFVFNEVMMGILAAIWIAMAITIYYLLQSTLISLLEASRWYLLFGLIGFSIAFLLRERLRLGILDGLYYNVFAVAPLSIVALLGINMMDSKTYTETHKVVEHQLYGDQYQFELENEAYAEFWRIRTIRIDTRPSRLAYIEFTFSDGLLGYKVMRDSRLF